MRCTWSSPRRMVAGATAEPSLPAGLSMQPGYVPGARVPWAMLAGSRARGEAAGVRAGRDADDAAEVPVKLALVVEADGLRRLDDARAALEQLAGARDAQVGQVLVG